MKALNLIEKRINRALAPSDLPPTQRRNYINVELDAIGIGLSNTAANFLPVFLTRLGATNSQVGWLSSMPAITGLLLAIPLGRFLQNRRFIVPWFSAARLGVISAYALTGLVTMLLPPQWSVIAILAVWALATLPQTVVSICFSVVMNAVAGPAGRFELMSRRWSILGITTFISGLIIGQILRADEVNFPINYQNAFIALSIGGLISFYFSSHIKLPPAEVRVELSGKTLREKVGDYLHLIRSDRPFISFLYKRFVYLSGFAMTGPLLPLYFVKDVQADDGWIGAITGARTLVLVIGYWLWTRQSRQHGNRRVLLWTTAGLGLYPILVALTHQPWQIAIYAGLAGIFQAGLDLVFFDELMKTVPPEYSATFVSFAQSVQFIPSIFAPLLGTFLGDLIGLGPALIVAGALSLAGFLLFLLDRRQSAPTASAAG